MPNESTETEDPLALATSSIPSADEVIANLRGRPAEQLDQCVWLVEFAETQGLQSWSALAKEIGVSDATVSLALRGKYGAKLDGFAATIRNFRALWLERQAIGAEPWVPELSIVQRIGFFCDTVRATNQIGLIWGPNQSGKSTTLAHYADDRALTAYCALPPGGAAVTSMQEIARARGGISFKKRDLRDQLLRRFNAQWLLIVDEFHQTVKGRVKMETIDRIREIHDRCKCPIVLCGTDIIPEMMEEPRFKDFLGQIGNRGVLRLRIPAAPEPRDLHLLARAYGIEQPPDERAAEIAHQIGAENGISKLTDYFKVARQLAHRAHERLGWKHFVITHATLESWAKGDFKPRKKPSNEVAKSNIGALES